MTDKQKLHEIAIKIEEWRIEMNRLDEMSRTFPSDLVTAQLITTANHISQLERIVYAPGDYT